MCGPGSEYQIRRSGARLFLLLLFLIVVLAGFAGWALSAEPSPTPIPVATPAPTPIDPTEWLSWLEAQPTAESFWLSYVERGLEVREWERVVQVPGAGCGVVSKMGYTLDESGEGLWAQGFVENEVSEPVSWMGRIFESVALAASDKAKVKSSHKFQKKIKKKPAHPKKVQWRDEYSIAW